MSNNEPAKNDARQPGFLKQGRCGNRPTRWRDRERQPPWRRESRHPPRRRRRRQPVRRAGGDSFSGGAGADRFILDEETLRLSGSGLAVQRDVIVDFRLSDGDRIDLSLLDPVAGGADDAFAFVARFTGQAGQATLTLSGGNTILRLDVDGDGKADHEVIIQGVSLTAADDAWIL